jgi:hypothetical protein
MMSERIQYTEQRNNNNNNNNNNSQNHKPCLTLQVSKWLHELLLKLEKRFNIEHSLCLSLSLSHTHTHTHTHNRTHKRVKSGRVGA